MAPLSNTASYFSIMKHFSNKTISSIYDIRSIRFCTMTSTIAVGLCCFALRCKMTKFITTVTMYLLFSNTFLPFLPSGAVLGALRWLESHFVTKATFVLIAPVTSPSRCFKRCSRRHNSSVNALTVLCSYGLDSQTLLNSK